MKIKLKGYRFSTALVLSSIALLLPGLAMAQGNPDAPIDGGVSLLLAAGAAYGVKKYREGKKKQEQDAGEDLK